jgi:hypothetical protein
VSRPGDADEQEADLAASRVVASSLSRSTSGATVHRRASASITPILRQSASAGAEAEECENCRIHRAASAAQPIAEVKEEEPSAEERVHRAALATHEELEAQAASPALQGRLLASQAGGRPLPGSVRERFEGHFGVDFTAVRVHTGADAADLCRDLGARAFTHGRHVYFAPGEWAPGSTEGTRLVAHELAHVVQQGSAPRQSGTSARGPPAAGTISETPASASVQREDGVGGFLGAVGEMLDPRAWLLDRLPAPVRSIVRRGPVRWLRDQVGGLLRGVVDRVSALLPAGALDQLSTAFDSLVQRASAIMAALASGDCAPLFQAITDLRTFVSDAAGAAWNHLVEYLTPVGDFFTGLWGNYGAPAVDAITNFGGEVWESLQGVGRQIWDFLGPAREVIGGAWDWVVGLFSGGESSSEAASPAPSAGEGAGTSPAGESEGGGAPENEQGVVDWLLGMAGQAWDWVKEQTRPVWEPVQHLADQVAELIPPPFIHDLGQQFGEFGQQLNATASNMGQEGDDLAENRQALANALPSLEEVIETVDQGIVTAGNFVTRVIGNLTNRARTFMTTLRSGVLRSLAGPLSWVSAMVTRLGTWAREGVGALFRRIRQTFQRLKPFIRRVAAVIEQVITVAGDLLALPQLVLDRAWGLIPVCLQGPIRDFLVEQILSRIPMFSTLAAVPDAWQQLQTTAMRILRQVFVDGDLAGAAWTFFQAMLRTLGIPPELIVEILAKAATAMGDILMDPIRFVTTMISGAIHGLVNFCDNIGDHLLGGITGWMFGTLASAGITIPSPVTLQSILGMVMELLGITADNLFDRLALQVEPQTVEQIRGAFEVASGVWEWVTVLHDEGVGGLWRLLTEQLSSLWDIVLDSAISWITTRVMLWASRWLGSMLDISGIMPTINTIMSIYNAIQSAIEYIVPMLRIVNTALDGIAAMARGDEAPAAAFVERAMVSSLPVAIGFLANQAGLGGIGGRIRELIEDARGLVNRGIDWLIRQALRLGRQFLDMVRSGAAAVRGAVESGIESISQWWGVHQEVEAADGESHRLYFEGSGASAHLMVRSTPRDFRWYLSRYNVADDDPQHDAKEAAKTEALEVCDEIEALKREPETEGRDITGEIQLLVQRLVAPAQILLVGAEGGIPLSTPPVYGNTVHTYGGSAEVVRLTKNKTVNGSPPGRTTSAGWRKLNRRRNPDNIDDYYYVRGHLINDNLWGPGTVWENLTPLTQWANNRGSDSHLRKVENPVKTEVLDNDRIVHYTVRAVYGRSVNQGLINAIAANDPQRTEKVELIEEEANIPRQLVCSATIVGTTREGDNLQTPSPIAMGDGVIENEIDESSIDDYKVKTP